MKSQAMKNDSRWPCVTSPAPRQAWQRLLTEDPTATTFQTPAWLDCICTTESYEDASRLYELPDGRQLVLPMVRRSWLPRSLTVEASLPAFWGTGGVVAAGSVRPEDVAAVWTDLVAGAAGQMRLRPGYMTASVWNAVQPPTGVTISWGQTHVLDLEGGFERVWKDRFKGPTRSSVRKAERLGLDVEFDAAGRLVPAFYELYLNWTARRARQRNLPVWLMKRHASRQESLREYQAVAEAFGDQCRIWVARSEGRAAAALIMLVHGARAFYWRGYSDMELAGRTRANVLLQRLAIEDACRAGCRWYNMGESGRSASLMEFKARFGAQPQQFPQYTFGRASVVRVQRWQRDLSRRAKRLLVRVRQR
jgi:hypothetical protein